MIEPHLPERFKSSIELYLEYGILPCSFLQSVLENDLKMAFANADVQSVRELPGLVCWLYNRIPIGAWGSPEKVRDWVEERHEIQRELKKKAGGE